MHRKNLLILVIDIMFLILIAIIIVISILKSATLTILTVPSDAIVKINNKDFKSGTYAFFPGEITATVEKDGFDKKEISMTLEKNANNRLFVYLTKEGNLSYIRDSSTDFETLKTISNLSENEELKSFVEKFEDEQALKKFLPITYTNPENQFFFNAFYDTEHCKEKDYCILLTGIFESDRAPAISYLEKFGYSSPDYEIIFDYRCKEGDFQCAF